MNRIKRVFGYLFLYSFQYEPNLIVLIKLYNKTTERLLYI